MADGRMLSRRITRSHKLAALSSDTARMIYSWLIPYLDVEGRMEADPDLLKADIAPLLKHITPEVIGDILNELQDVGLITLYSVSGRTYLQLQQFERNQKNLRKDREAPSSIPAPANPPHVRINSGPTPEELRTNAGIREEKRSLREVEGGVGETKHLSVDNPEGCSEKPPLKAMPPDQKEGSLKKPQEKKPPSRNTHGERWTQQQGIELNTLGDEIRDRYGTRYHQKVQVWLQTNYNRKNPTAMLNCLKRLIQEKQKGESIPLPDRWLDAVLNGNGKQPGENGKAEAAESERECQAHKRDFTDLKSLMPPALVGAAP